LFNFEQIKKSLLASIWFMFLTFPIMVIRVNTVENEIEWRWHNVVFVGVGSFFLSFLWRYMIRQKELGSIKVENSGKEQTSFVQGIVDNKKVFFPLAAILSLFIIAFPFVFSLYQTTIMTTALIYIMLGLGLNIVVGMAGLLDLGYIAFYAVGAYSYALLNYHFGLSFWIALPLGGLIGALFGVILGFPVLRLRGDYLAIVTLAFGEIIRLVMENWNEFSFGPSGISGIPKPSLFGLDLSMRSSANFMYFIILGMAIFAVFMVNRLQNSRLGRAWIALREDEVACQAMGINKTLTKLTAFALGATWAGMGGVLFAAKTRFINPMSFTIWESIIVLCIVVLGGMGSILGVIVAALFLILVPEYLRAFSEYRLLLFGIILVLMMVFKPGGIISDVRKTYQFKKSEHQG
jgi:branched-chain amino acid transport system permease protein